MKTLLRIIIVIFTLTLFLSLTACSDLGYYWHSTRGHMDIISKRQAIDGLIESETIDEKLREKLILVQSIRQFAEDRLALPVDNSYSEYVQLDRPYVLQNLFAAPEFSTRLKTWCYPFAGCTSYRGYFEEARLNTFVDNLKEQNYDIHIGRVSAYSTLGWFDDPVLSSFINRSDYRLAGLLFHEVTHQRLYIDNDTTFNESLASAVEQLGIEIWLENQNRQKELDQYRRWLIYKTEVIELITQTRNKLTELYASSNNDNTRRQEKKRIFEQARDQHKFIADSHDVERGYRDWFSNDLNNAKIGSISAYNSQVAEFITIFRYHINDFEKAFKVIDAIGELDREKRNLCLDAWLKTQPPTKDCLQD